MGGLAHCAICERLDEGLTCPCCHCGSSDFLLPRSGRRSLRTAVSVFLSSTGADLTEFRNAVRDQLGRIPCIECIAQEIFGAQDSAPVEYCREVIQSRTDIYLGIVGLRRGFEPAGDPLGRSITEMEYDWAREVNIPRFILMLPDAFPLRGDLRESDNEYQRQRRFRERLRKERIVQNIDLASPGMVAAEAVRTVTNHIIMSDLILRLRPNLFSIRATHTQKVAIAPLKVAVDQLIADDLINPEKVLGNPEAIDISTLPDGLARRARAIESESGGEISTENRLKSAHYYRAAGALAFYIDTSRSLSFYIKATELEPNCTEAWHKRADLLSRLGNHGDAMQCYEKACELATLGNDPIALASSYVGLGRIYQSLGDLSKSALILQRAVSVSQGTSAPELWAPIVLGLGLLDILAGNSRGAIDKFESIVNASERIDRMEIIAVASNGLGFINWTEGNSRAARRAFEDASEISTELDLREELAKSRAGLGLLEFTAGHIEESRRHLGFALDLGRRIESAEIEAYTVYGLGLVEWAKGELQSSESYFDRARELGERLKIPQIMAGCSNGQALMSWIRGDVIKAEEEFTRAAQSSKEIGFKNGLATAWNGLGLVKLATGEVDLAARAFRAAQALGRELNAPQIGVAADNGLGVVYLERGHAVLAERFFDRARRTSEEIGLVAGVAVALNGLGAVFTRSGLLDRAWECFSRAIEISIEHRLDVVRAASSVGRGWIEKRRGNIGAARAHWLEALEFYKERKMSHFARKVEHWIVNELKERG